MSITKTVIAGVFLSSVLGFATLAGAQSVPIAAEQISSDERGALIALYDATDGNHWTNHDGWLGAEGTECDWHGITCDYNYDFTPFVLNVAYIELSENNLVGSIPDRITNLTSLKGLSIAGNHLTGRVPGELVERWLSGALRIVAENSLLTNVSKIDFESSPSALLCGREGIIFALDGQATLFTTRCRKATPGDRTTFCEAKEGQIYNAFATLAWLIEKKRLLRPEARILTQHYRRYFPEHSSDSKRQSLRSCGRCGRRTF